jgi:hypothetical protein
MALLAEADLPTLAHHQDIGELRGSDGSGGASALTDLFLSADG